MGQGIWSKMTGAFSSGQGEDDGADRRKNKEGSPVRFAVFMPSSQEDARQSVDALKSGSGVVINGEKLDNAGYQRVMDFMDGAAYVLGGTGRPVSETVQVYGPSTMEIVDETVSYYGNLSTGKKRSDG